MNELALFNQDQKSFAFKNIIGQQADPRSAAFNIISVTDAQFGAKGDGVTDDTAAIQAAITAVGANGCVWFPAGTYKTTSALTITHSRVYLRGMGSYATEILFAPTAGATCFAVGAGASVLFQGGIIGMAIYSNDSTFTKVGIELSDVSTYLLDDVTIGGGVVVGSATYWSGANSIGLRIKGREATTINRLTINADRPILIADNPNSAIDIDHFHFHDCYLVANANPVVEISTGVNLSNVTFDGYQAWVAGTHGLYWLDTTSAQVSYNLTIRNVRTEQGTDATAYAVRIERNSALLGLLIEANYGGTDRKGYYFRNVQTWHIKDSTYTSATKEALNIDGGTYIGKGTNNLWQSGATATIAGLNVAYKSGAASNATLASDFLYESTYNLVTTTFASPFKIPSLLMASPRTGTGATDTITFADSAFIANRAGTITLTLESAASVPGRFLTIRTIQAQTVVSDAANVVPLAGGAAGTAILAATAGKWAILQSDSSNWQIMAAN